MWFIVFSVAPWTIEGVSLFHMLRLHFLTAYWTEQLRGTRGFCLSFSFLFSIAFICRNTSRSTCHWLSIKRLQFQRLPSFVSPLWYYLVSLSFIYNFVVIMPMCVLYAPSKFLCHLSLIILCLEPVALSKAIPMLSSPHLLLKGTFTDVYMCVVLRSWCLSYVPVIRRKRKTRTFFLSCIWCFYIYMYYKGNCLLTKRLLYPTLFHLRMYSLVLFLVANIYCIYYIEVSRLSRNVSRKRLRQMLDWKCKRSLFRYWLYFWHPVIISLLNREKETDDAYVYLNVLACTSDLCFCGYLYSVLEINSDDEV